MDERLAKINAQWYHGAMHGEGRQGKGKAMRREFAAFIEQDDGWHIAYSPEVSGANGQGRTQAEALKSLADAIELILTDRRLDALNTLPADAIQTTVLVS